MDRNFEVALENVLKHEGGWADHPKDPGGATMKGVTLATFRRFVKADATKDELKKISNAQLRTVYRRQYWDAVQGAELPDGVDYAVFDFAVNSGPKRAAQFLQRVVGAKDDGKIGPETLKLIRAKSPEFVIKELQKDRLAWLKTLSTWKTFGKGWTRRVEEVRLNALDLAAQPTPENPSVIVEEKPVVPPKIEAEVKDKTNKVNWGLGAGGVLGTILTWAAGQEWQTIVAVGGVSIVAIVVLFALRKWIISGIKEIRENV